MSLKEILNGGAYSNAEEDYCSNWDMEVYIHGVHSLYSRPKFPGARDVGARLGTI